MRAGKLVRWVAVCALALLTTGVLFPVRAPAGPIYDLPPGVHVIYEDVSEQVNTLGDGDKLFNAPMLVGDSLLFANASFAVVSDAGTIDHQDSVLRFRLAAKPDYGIASLKFSEFGSYTLAGLPGSSASVMLGTPAKVEILAVNGFDLLAPISVMPTVVYTGLSASGSADLASIAPAMGVSGVPWTATLSFDFAGALQANGYDGLVTKLQYNMSNSVLAIATTGAYAYVDEQTAKVEVQAIPVPEPSAWVLLSMAGAGLAWFVRRKRS